MVNLDRNQGPGSNCNPATFHRSQIGVPQKDAGRGSFATPRLRCAGRDLASYTLPATPCHPLQSVKAGMTIENRLAEPFTCHVLTITLITIVVTITGCIVMR